MGPGVFLHFLVAGVVFLVVLVVAVAAAFYVYGDARKRYPEDSAAPVVWAVLVFLLFLFSLLLGLVALVLYLLVRPPRRAA